MSIIDMKLLYAQLQTPQQIFEYTDLVNVPAED